MIDATTADTLTVRVADRAQSFPPAKSPASVGAHRFCNVVIDGTGGEFPVRAAVFSFEDGAWFLANTCNRHVVMHADGHPALSLPPGGRVGLTGAPFVLSVPGGAVAAEVPVWFGSDSSFGSGMSPWVRLAGTPSVPDLLDPPAAHAPCSSRAGVVVALFVAVMLLLSAGGVAVLTQSSRLTAAARPEHPPAWDPSLADLVAFVEKDRQLTFNQPVYVDFLTPEEFEATVGGDPSEISAEDRREMAQMVGLLRAVGLIEGDVDLFDRVSQVQSEGTLAFYSAQTERVRVRGTELNEAVRGTLVHELTHALQDQHFDLKRLGGDDDDRLRAVVEGDAVRTEEHWADQLDPAARAAYDAQSQAAGDGADFEGVPEVLLALFGGPYQFGRGFVETLAAVGGTPAIDRALQTPPASDEQLLDPFRYLARDMPVPVAEPALKRGEKRLDGDETFGALTLFLMLAQRVDEREALRAVDGWGGDAYVDFERDGRVCTRVAVRGDTPTDTDELARTLDNWVRSMPPGAASTSAGGGGVELEACDPGTDFKMGEPRMLEAESYPITRTAMAVDFIGQGMSSDRSRCVAGGLIDQFELELLASDGEPTTAQKRTIGQVTATCRP